MDASTLPDIPPGPPPANQNIIQRDVINPLSSPRIRYNFFSLLARRDLVVCARVSYEWYLEAYFFLGRPPVPYNLHMNHLYEDIPSIFRTPFLQAQAQPIGASEYLTVNQENINSVMMQLVRRSTLVSLTIEGQSMRLTDISILIDLLYLINPTLEILCLEFPCFENDVVFGNFLDSLKKTRRLRQLTIQGALTGRSNRWNHCTSLRDLDLAFLTHLQITETKSLLFHGGNQQNSSFSSSLEWGNRRGRMLDLVQLISSCRNLVDLVLDIPDHIHALGFTQIQYSILLKTITLTVPLNGTIGDLELFWLLRAFPWTIQQVDIMATQIGIGCLTALTRFRNLTDVYLGSNQSKKLKIPGCGVIAVLTQCSGLIGLVIQAEVDITDLALGLTWICQDLVVFFVELIGESRLMTNKELIQGGFKPSWFENDDDDDGSDENQGKEGEPQQMDEDYDSLWMIYWRLSQLRKLRHVEVRIYGISTHDHDAWSSGFDQLSSLNRLDELFVPNFVSFAEIELLMESWPRLEALIMVGDTEREQEHATMFFKALYPKVEVTYEN